MMIFFSFLEVAYLSIELTGMKVPSRFRKRQVASSAVAADIHLFALEKKTS